MYSTASAIMKFGLSVINFGEYFNPRTVADLARDAEKAGWDGGFYYGITSINSEALANLLRTGCFFQS